MTCEEQLQYSYMQGKAVPRTSIHQFLVDVRIKRNIDVTTFSIDQICFNRVPSRERNQPLSFQWWLDKILKAMKRTQYTNVDESCNNSSWSQWLINLHLQTLLSKCSVIITLHNCFPTTVNICKVASEYWRGCCQSKLKGRVDGAFEISCCYNVTAMASATTNWEACTLV